MTGIAVVVRCHRPCCRGKLRHKPQHPYMSMNPGSLPHDTQPVDELLGRLPEASVVAHIQQRFGEPCVFLEHDSKRLVISLLGAQILEWSSGTGNGPLWVTDENLHTAGNPIRGGIPLCWPWFGPAHAPFQGPSHGFGRRRSWKLMSANTEDGRLTLHFRLDVSGDGYRLRADYQVSAGRNLALQLMTTNLGETACPVTPAFHPYFPIHDITRTRLHMASPVQPRNRLSGQPCSATNDVSFTGDEQELEWTPWSELELESASGSRLEIHSDDATHCVAWNPGPRKTATISDLHPDAFRKFVCVEPARLDPGVSTIPAGGQAKLSMTLSCA